MVMNFGDQSKNITVGDLDATAPVPSGYAVLDVREQDEWDAGHVAGAVHIPLSELPTRIEELPDDDLIVVCRSGGRSGQATDWLNHTGYDAINLDGGLKAWEAAGLPLTTPGGQDPRVL